MTPCFVNWIFGKKHIPAAPKKSCKDILHTETIKTAVQNRRLQETLVEGLSSATTLPPKPWVACCRYSLDAKRWSDRIETFVGSTPTTQNPKMWKWLLLRTALFKERNATGFCWRDRRCEVMISWLPSCLTGWYRGYLARNKAQQVRWQVCLPCI